MDSGRATTKTPYSGGFTMTLRWMRHAVLVPALACGFACHGLVDPAGVARAAEAPEITPPATTPLTARAGRELLQCPRDLAAGRSSLQSALNLARQGELARSSELIDEALAYDPRNPHVHLVRALRDRDRPGAAWESLQDAARASVAGFPNQLSLSLNVFLIILWSVCLGIIGTAGAVVFRYVRHVHHSLRETLAGKAGGAAPFAAALVLLAPLLWGVGLVATLVFFLLWFSPILRASERKLVFPLAGVGIALWITHFVSPGPLAPPGDGHAPFRVAMAFETGGTPGYYDDLDVSEPDGYAAWARGMWAKRAGRYEEAEKELREALTELPKSTALLVDLGNTQFLRGELRAAKKSYSAALERNDDCAEAHYNLAQVLTQELDLLGADAAVETALRLNPGRISEFDDGPAKTLRSAAIDMLPGVAPFWISTLLGEGLTGSIPLPAGLKLLSPGGRIGFMPIGLGAVVVLGLLAAQWLKRSVKTHSCRSCGMIVCRRCLIRVDGEPYCHDCGNTLSADCSTEYSKALLERYFRKRYTPRSVLARVVRWFLPGWAEVSSWPVVRSSFVLSLTGCALLTVSLPGPPISPDPAGASIPFPGLVVWGVAGLLYAIAHLATWRWRGDEDTKVDEEEEPRRAAS